MYGIFVYEVNSESAHRTELLCSYNHGQLKSLIIIIIMFRPLAEGWMQWSSILGGVVPV